MMTQAHKRAEHFLEHYLTSKFLLDKNTNFIKHVQSSTRGRKKNLLQNSNKFYLSLATSGQIICRTVSLRLEGHPELL